MTTNGTPHYLKGNPRSLGVSLARGRTANVYAWNAGLYSSFFTRMSTGQALTTKPA